MTLHAAFIRRAGARHYRCTTCLTRVTPAGRVAHLNAAIAARYGRGTPTTPLEDQ